MLTCLAPNLSEKRHVDLHLNAWNISMNPNNVCSQYLHNEINFNFGMNGMFNMNKCINIWINSETNAENEPFKSPSVVYLGNFAIYFICKPEKYNIQVHTSCKHYGLRTGKNVSNLHSIAYVSNSLKQLIELVDSLTSASVPETLSMGPHCWSLEFWWTSFSKNKITRILNSSHTAYFPRSSRTMIVTSNVSSSHFWHFFFAFYTRASHDGILSSAVGKVSFSMRYCDRWTINSVLNTAESGLKE